MPSIAHMGYGYWGKNIARNLAELGFLKAVIDPDPGAAQNAAGTLGVAAASLDEVLADPGIDGLSIASPAEMHFDHAAAALQAGKHVFVEKPLALKADDARALCALAEEKGLVLMVGHLLQYHPIYRKLRELVEDGALGRILYAYSNRMSLGKFRIEENVLWSFAPHDISMLLGIFNEEPSHVSAQGNTSFTHGIADIVTAQMHFPSGGSAHIQTCWMHPFKEQRLTVIGSKAMAVFEDSNPNWSEKLKLYRHSFDTSGPVPIPQKADAETVEVEPAEPLKSECLHFAQCIDGKQRPRTDGDEGLRVLTVLERAESALQRNLEFQQSRGL